MLRRTFPAALAIIAFASAHAYAVEGCYYVGFGGSPWGGYAPQTFDDQRVPYFAAHPPVYYGSINRRDYGQTPYPYLPPIAPTSNNQYAPVYLPQQASQPVSPQWIRNPYVSESVPAPQPSPTAPKAPMPSLQQP